MRPSPVPWGHWAAAACRCMRCTRPGVHRRCCPSCPRPPKSCGRCPEIAQRQAGPACDNRGMTSFAPLQNDTFLRACLRQATDHTPIWLMRQAGRYLPEYCATRAKAGSFMGLATHVDYATEVTLQPMERYPLDAAILFSDILTVPDAMGLGLSFAQGEGPRFAKNVRDEAAVAQLAVPDMDKLRYVFDAVTSIRKALNGRVPLIGFSGSPWTLACYMVEGKGGTDFLNTKKMAYARPDLLHHIL